MKRLLIILYSISLLSCRQEISSDQIILKHGLYIDKETNSPLNGKFVSITYSKPNDPIKTEHRTFCSYKNGIPNSKWSYYFNGDLIQEGEYLEEGSIEKDLRKIMDCQRVDIDLWREGDSPLISLNIINPAFVDPARTQQLIDSSLKKIRSKYYFGVIFIDQVSDTLEKELKRVNL